MTDYNPVPDEEKVNFFSATNKRREGKQVGDVNASAEGAVVVKSQTNPDKTVVLPPLRNKKKDKLKQRLADKMASGN